MPAGAHATLGHVLHCERVDAAVEFLVQGVLLRDARQAVGPPQARFLLLRCSPSVRIPCGRRSALSQPCGVGAKSVPSTLETTMPCAGCGGQQPVGFVEQVGEPVRCKLGWR